MLTTVTYDPTSPSIHFTDDSSAFLTYSDSALESTQDLGCHITSTSWFPSQGKQPIDMLAAGASDGTIRFIKRNGSTEKKIPNAHSGATTKVCWNLDGTSLVSGGEDGDVKIWSRNGNLRSLIVSVTDPVMSVNWGPDNDGLLVASGGNISIVRTQTRGKTLEWKVVDQGVILCCDWNPVTNTIICGSEDCRYRIYDPHGLPLYTSNQSEHVITSVRWNPMGTSAVVGSFNLIRVADRTGWTYGRYRPQVGSIMDVEWSPDGTELACATGSGKAVFAQVVDRTLSYGAITATLVDPHRITVADAETGSFEDLDFPRDRVVEFAFGHDHLVVCTVSQCFVYESPNYNTPQIFDLKHPVNLIVMGVRSFAIVDTVSGVGVYSYEGRLVSTPKFQGLRPELLSGNHISLASDVVAILDRTDFKTVRLFDGTTGRPLPNGEIKHDQEITKITLNQFSTSTMDRRLAFLDSNRELFITPTSNLPGVPKKFATRKLATQVDSMAWNDCSDCLACIADSRMIVHYYPHALYVDKDLLPLTMDTKDGSEFGKAPTVQNFFGTTVSVRRADGALLTSAVEPYPAMLYEYVSAGRFQESVRLCRFIKSPQLWATLAGMAIYHQDLDSAEVALSAVKEVDKLQFIKYIKGLESSEVRNAEMMLYKRCPAEAESILLQASPPLVYHAIEMNIRLFKWERAMELAEKHKRHADVVAFHRRRFLKEFGRREDMSAFSRFADMDLNEDDIADQERAAREEEGGGDGGRK